MKEDSIGVIPTNGYRLSENQSKIALKWLYFVEMDSKIQIQHAGKGKEFFHQSFGRVDGYHAPTNTVLEFNGCWYHGCTCFPSYFSDDGETLSPTSELLRQRRDDTLAKQMKISMAGFNLIVKRECDFKREMEENPALEILLNTMVE